MIVAFFNTFLKTPLNFIKRVTLLSITAIVICNSAQAQEVYDPIEPVNRGIFWFNDKLDVYVLEPVARGYDDYVPESVQTGVGNFFENLRFPRYFVSDIVQLKFGQVWHHTSRFVINSTVGVLGILDVAKDFGFEKHEEDFGIALAYHDVPPGPYLVLPLLGPSNLRDGFGRLVDSFLDPISALTYTSVDDDIAIPVIIGTKALDLIDTRADLLEAVETAKSSSLDYYLFVQGAYMQHRRGVLYDGNPPDELGDEAGDEFGSDWHAEPSAQAPEQNVDNTKDKN